ncbi:phage virion morphogenesis protein [Arthrobacter sulfonylureivorans]|uniref:phage virion morphogenesis protein n=1 Tax=Arthrobacter sulfonylureivorans TaxID=2486855 RepID=UPI0039E5A959
MGAKMRLSGDGFRPLIMDLERYSSRAGDAEPMFQGMADQVAAENLQQFTALGAYYGARWKPLSPRYAAWKKKRYPSKPLMVLSGLLRESLTERPMGIDEVWDRGMVVGTAVPYARYHQKGNPETNLPQRKLVGRPTKAGMKRYGSFLHQWIFNGKVAA